MRTADRVAVVIPCYNTSRACVDVITSAAAMADTVLAVDDGSTDDTAEHIKSAGCLCLRLPVNGGKGAALKAGIQEVLKGPGGMLGQAFDYIITLDGDGQHDAAHIPRFLEAAQRDRADLVLGVRNVRVMPPKSKIGNYISRILFYLGTGRYVQDTQSGFRLLSASLANSLVTGISWRRYETEAEMLTRAVATGYNVATVEIPTIYFDGNRRTHFDPLWDSMRVMAVLSRYALSSLAVTAVDISAFVLLLPHVPDLITANVLARVASVAVHFVLSRDYVFRLQGRFHVAQLIRYAGAVLANLALTTWLIMVLQRQGIDPLTAKILAQLAGFFVTFLLLDRLVFRRPLTGRTNWEEYYRRPFVTARWSRRIMEKMLVRWIEQYAGETRPLSVLELGGGNSCFLPALMQATAIDPYTLLDNSPEGMRLARERFQPVYGDRVSYITDDVFAARLDRKYDLVFSVGLIEHFDETELKRLVGLHREWVRDGGLVLIVVPTPTILYRITRGLAEVAGLWRFPDERPIPARRLEALLREQGLVPIDQRVMWSQILTQAIIAARPGGTPRA